jgi:hypothetical protein
MPAAAPTAAPRKGTGMIIGGGISLGLGVPLLGWSIACCWRDGYIWPGGSALAVALTATGGALLGVGLHRRARWQRGDPVMDVEAYPAARRERIYARRARAKIISGSVLIPVAAVPTAYIMTGMILVAGPDPGLLGGLAVSGSLLITGGVLLGVGLKQRRAMGEAYHRAFARTPARRWSPFVGGVGPLHGKPRVITPTYGVNLQF